MDPEASWYYRVFEATASGIFVYTAEGRLMAVNPAGCRMAGRTREEMLRMDPRDFIAPESHHVFGAFREALLRGEDFEGEAQGLHKDGSRYDAEVTGTTVVIDGKTCLLSSLKDVSDRNSLQRQLMEAQRMEAVGNLAGGIAHDFNNLLGVILGYAEVVKESLGPESPELESLDHILEASTRAATLTSRLLAFGRKQMLSLRLHDLNVVLDSFAPVLERVLGGPVTVKPLLSPLPCIVSVDIAQIEQVLLNLALNARNAMPAGGRLILELETVTVDEPQPHTKLEPGSYVVLSVSDDGCGIADEHLDKLFEPFFTTHRESGGSGLGLSMVHGIVSQLGGKITVYSELGVGTTFRIYLPEAVGTPSHVPPPAEATIDLGGTEHVVVVDDNASLHGLISTILREHGYAVRAFGGPSEILALSDEELGHPDLLITDVMMPELNGKVLYGELVKRVPDLRVLYASGYTENVIVKLGVLNSGIDFLVKPFTVKELAHKVRSILNRNRTAPG